MRIPKKGEVAKMWTNLATSGKECRDKREKGQGVVFGKFFRGIESVGTIPLIYIYKNSGAGGQKSIIGSTYGSLRNIFSRTQPAYNSTMGEDS